MTIIPPRGFSKKITDKTMDQVRFIAEQLNRLYPDPYEVLIWVLPREITNRPLFYVQPNGKPIIMISGIEPDWMSPEEWLYEYVPCVLSSAWAQYLNFQDENPNHKINVEEWD
jgi:hypothetical protein